MIRIVQDFRYPIRTSLISDIERSLYDSFRLAFDSGQKETLREINNFQQKLLFTAFGKRAPEVINQLIFLPVYFYHIVSKDDEMRSYLLNSVSVAYKTSSFFFKESAIEKSNIKFDRGVEIACAEKFYEGVVAFYHTISIGSDHKEIEQAFNEFNQMQDDVPLVPHLRSAIKEHIKNGDLVDATHLREKFEIDHYTSILHRRTSLCLKAWFVFLYDIGEIQYDRFSFLYNLVDLRYYYFDDLLDDIVYIRNHELSNFLGVSHWDYTERLDGKVYHPPTVRDWIIHGLLAFMLTGNAPHFDESVIIEKQDYTFLYDRVKETLEGYKRELPKWGRFMGLSAMTNNEGGVEISIDELFDQRAREILNVFEKLRIIQDEAKNREVIRQTVDKERVNRFKQALADKWKQQCTCFNLFYHFGNVVIKGNSEGLPFLGGKIFMDKFKMMFVENGQQIFGSADIGADLGRRTDNTFIAALFEQKPDYTEHESVEKALEENLLKLSGRGFTPNLIIIPPEFMYATDLSTSKEFSQATTDDKSEFPRWGYYRSIPVVSFYAPYLKNQLIIAAFEESISLEIFESDELYFRQLYVEVKELTEPEVEAEYNKNLEKRNRDENFSKLNEQQVKDRIRMSLNLEIWTRAKFISNNKEAYLISIIKNLEL